MSRKKMCFFGMNHSLNKLSHYCRCIVEVALVGIMNRITYDIANEYEECRLLECGAV
jgi:hypothetical protein